MRSSSTSRSSGSSRSNAVRTAAVSAPATAWSSGPPSAAGRSSGTSRSVRWRPREQLVDDVAGDAEQPGVEAAALPREAVDAVEGPGHRLAHDVLGGPVVEQAAPGEPEQRAVRASVQRLPGVGVAARRSRDEVAQLLIRHAPEPVELPPLP